MFRFAKIFYLLLVSILGNIESTYGGIGVPEAELYPFSDHSVLVTSAGFAGRLVTLNFDFSFANKTYRQFFLSNNGYITFQQTAAPTTDQECLSRAAIPMVTPFWVHIDTTDPYCTAGAACSGRPGTGSVHYKEYTADPKKEVFEKAAKDIAAHNPIYRNIKIGWAFVVTWNKVSPFNTRWSVTCSGGIPQNTFQAVLATDGIFTFAIFYYSNITWISEACESKGASCDFSSKPPAYVDPCGMRNTPAKVGFDAGASTSRFSHLKGLSCDAGLINITSKTNVGQAVGKFVFQIDEEVPPEGLCKNSSAAKLYATPSIVSAMGHFEIRLHGPCFEESWIHLCNFHDSVRGDMVTHGTLTQVSDADETPAISCNVPYLYTDGHIEVTLESFDVPTNYYLSNVPVNFQNASYSSNVTVFLGEPGVTTKLLVRNETSVGWEITWPKSKFKGFGFVNIHLIYLDRIWPYAWRTFEVKPFENSGKAEWTIQLSNLPKETALGLSGFKVTKPYEQLVSGTTGSVTDVLECANQLCTLPSTNRYLFNSSLSYESCYKFWNPAGKQQGDNIPLVELDSQTTVFCRYVDDAMVSLPLLPLADKEVARKECREWLEGQKTGRTDGVPPCPPLESQARVDPFFVPVVEPQFSELWPEAVSSFRSTTLSPSGMAQRSNYNSKGQVLGGYSGGTPDLTLARFPPTEQNQEIFDHMLNNILPRSHCCLHGSDSNECRKYFTVRPVSDCSNYVPPPPPGRGRGDPHIQTMDQLDYTFNGDGEFWMIKPKDNSFSMQARMEAIEGGASVFTAFVMKDGSSGNVVQVQLSQLAVSEVFINGEIADFSKSLQTTLMGGTVIRTENLDMSKIVVSFPSGFAITFSIAHGVMAVSTTVSKNKFGKMNVAGLLGDFNGNSDDDLLTPDGKLIPSNSNLSVIHFEFGLKWAIKSSESLFTYDNGMKPEDYSNPGFVPNLVDVDVSQASPEALEICGTSRTCLFDFNTTGGNVAIANFTKSVDQVANETMEILTTSPKMCPSLIFPADGFIDSVSNAAFVGSVVKFGCFDGYYLDGAESITCLENESWSSATPNCFENADLALIIGLAVGLSIFAILVVAGVLAFCWYRSRKSTSNSDSQVEMK